METNIIEKNGELFRIRSIYHTKLQIAFDLLLTRKYKSSRNIATAMKISLNNADNLLRTLYINSLVICKEADGCYWYRRAK